MSFTSRPVPNRISLRNSKYKPYLQSIPENLPIITYPTLYHMSEGETVMLGLLVTSVQKQYSYVFGTIVVISAIILYGVYTALVHAARAYIPPNIPVGLIGLGL